MKPFTELSIITTKMKVPASDSRIPFSEVSSRWQSEPWVKYLYEHAAINCIDTYKDAEDYSNVYVVKWKLDTKKSILFHLTWSDQINKIYT
jgi:hypothetical protein